MICCRGFALAVMGLFNNTCLHHIVLLSDFLRVAYLLLTSSACAGDLCCEWAWTGPADKAGGGCQAGRDHQAVLPLGVQRIRRHW